MSVQMARLGDLFPRIAIGGTPSRGNPVFFGGANVWVSIRDMEGKSIITDSSEHLSDKGVANSNCKLVRNGSLLFSFKLTVGRVAFAGVDLYTNEAIAAFDPADAKQSGVDLMYLSLVLPAIARADTTKNSMGAALLNKEKISNLEIPLPDIEDQLRIAARLKEQLAALDTARVAAKARLREAELLKTQALGSVFNAVKQSCPIGNVAVVQSGFAFKSQEFRDRGVRLLRNANILPCRVYWDDAAYFSPDDAPRYSGYELHEGDVLISLDRPIISSGIKVARVGKADLPALLVQRVGRFQINEKQLDADYLYAFLQTQRFIEAITGHDQSLGVPHISPTQVEAIDIPLPSLDEQKHLAKIATQISSETDTIRRTTQDTLSEISVFPPRLLAQAFETGTASA